MLNFNKTDCYCCGKIRRHPRAKWAGCLKFNKCARMNVQSHNVLASSNAQHSKIMRNVRKLNGGKWRKVNWRRFQAQTQTKQYQTKVIANSTNNPSTFVVRHGKILNPIEASTGTTPIIESTCPTALDLTWNEITLLSQDKLSNIVGVPLSCKKPTMN